MVATKILAIGGILSSLLLTLGFSKSAGLTMLIANLICIFKKEK